MDWPALDALEEILYRENACIDGDDVAGLMKVIRREIVTGILDTPLNDGRLLIREQPTQDGTVYSVSFHEGNHIVELCRMARIGDALRFAGSYIESETGGRY